MAYFGTVATVATQAAPAEKFAAAFAYLNDLFAPDSEAAARVRSVAVGETRRVELAGGAFALEQAYWTKTRPEGFFESHRKYIDVQVIFEGEEFMEVIDLAHAREKVSYDADRDLIVHADSADASQLRLRAGEAAVFFPADVHMPCLKTGPEKSLVRKTVVKVPV